MSEDVYRLLEHEKNLELAEKQGKSEYEVTIDEGQAKFLECMQRHQKHWNQLELHVKAFGRRQIHSKHYPLIDMVKSNAFKLLQLMDGRVIITEPVIVVDLRQS